MELNARDHLRLKVLAGLIGCLLYSAAAYFLLDWFLGRGGQGSGVSVTLTFLIAVPAALASFISYASDPEGERSLIFHLRLCLIPAVAVIVGGLVLQEGVICILMLLPIWGLTALVVTVIAYFVRRSARRTGGLRSSPLLLVPLLAAQLEAMSAVPVSLEQVDRSIIIDAPPERIWPLLVAVRDIRPDEGRWNITQDVLGVPRPIQAVIEMRGGKPVRLAQWGSQIRFEERISEWTENRSLRWRFAFPDDSIREHTDRHIAPDGAHLTITDGAYRLTPLAGGRTEVTLETRYELRTPVNPYASWWGGWMLGDIQDNILQIIKDRAESG
jgi:hypothetical protein